MSIDKRKGGRGVLAVLAVISVVGLLGSWVVYEVYAKRSDSQVVRRLGWFLPVAKVGAQSVTFGQFLQARDAIKTYLKSPAVAAQGGPTTLNSDFESNAYQRLLREAAERELAAQRAVAITDKDVKDSFEKALTQTSSTQEEVAKYLKDTFNWTPEEYQQIVFKPQVLEEKLAATFASGTTDTFTQLDEYLTARLAKPDVKKFFQF